MQRLLANLIQMARAQAGDHGHRHRQRSSPSTGVVGYYLSRPSHGDALRRPRSPGRQQAIGAALTRCQHRHSTSVLRRGTTVSVRYGADGPRRACCLPRRACRIRANCRLRTLRQDGLARPHLLHAGRDARPRPRRGTRAHHPVDVRGASRPRPHRAAGRGVLSPRASQPAVGLRNAARRDPRPIRACRPGHPPSRRGGGARHDHRPGHGRLNTDGTVLASGERSRPTGRRARCSRTREAGRSARSRTSIRQARSPPRWGLQQSRDQRGSTKLNMDANRQTAETIYNPDSTRRALDPHRQGPEQTSFRTPSSAAAHQRQPRTLPQQSQVHHQRRQDIERAERFQARGAQQTTRFRPRPSRPPVSAGYARSTGCRSPIVLNRSATLAGTGAEKATPDQIATKLADIEQPRGLGCPAFDKDARRHDEGDWRSISSKAGTISRPAPSASASAMRSCGSPASLINAGVAAMVVDGAAGGVPGGAARAEDAVATLDAAPSSEMRSRSASTRRRC